MVKLSVTTEVDKVKQDYIPIWAAREKDGVVLILSSTKPVWNDKYEYWEAQDYISIADNEKLSSVTFEKSPVRVVITLEDEKKGNCIHSGLRALAEI